MSANHNYRDWYYNFPVLESTHENGFKHHLPGAICVHKGNEGFKFYVIRATKITDIKARRANIAFVQLLSCPDRKIEDTSTRKRVTERYFGEIYVLDVEKYMENEARMFTEMMDLAKLRLTQRDAIDKLAAKHGDLNS